jgi:broad specificity phosphatase PhoE
MVGISRMAFLPQHNLGKPLLRSVRQSTFLVRPACEFVRRHHGAPQILKLFGLAVDDRTGCLVRDSASQFKLQVDVVFIRHSTTVFNEEKIVQGRFCPDHEGRPRDPGLSQKGREAALVNAAVIQERYPDIRLVVTSPQARAKETADILFSGMGVQRVIAESFSELHVGRLEGVLKRKQHPSDVHLYHERRNAVHKIGQTGESAIEKLTSLGNALLEINRRYGGQSCPVGVVTHSNTIGLLKVLLGSAERKEIDGVMAYRLRNLQTANNEDLFFKRS